MERACHCIQIDSKAHPASQQIDTQCLSLGGKAAAALISFVQRIRIRAGRAPCLRCLKKRLKKESKQYIGEKNGKRYFILLSQGIISNISNNNTY
jgi:hypothetical protein